MRICVNQQSSSFIASNRCAGFVGSGIVSRRGAPLPSPGPRTAIRCSALLQLNGSRAPEHTRPPWWSRIMAGFNSRHNAPISRSRASRDRRWRRLLSGRTVTSQTSRRTSAAIATAARQYIHRLRQSRVRGWWSHLTKCVPGRWAFGAILFGTAESRRDAASSTASADGSASDNHPCSGRRTCVATHPRRTFKSAKPFESFTACHA